MTFIGCIKKVRTDLNMSQHQFAKEKILTLPCLTVEEMNGLSQAD
jgi:DNA-binding transcriptional regulator YiaG